MREVNGWQQDSKWGKIHSVMRRDALSLSGSLSGFTYSNISSMLNRLFTLSKKHNFIYKHLSICSRKISVIIPAFTLPNLTLPQEDFQIITIRYFIFTSSPFYLHYLFFSFYCSLKKKYDIPSTTPPLMLHRKERFCYHYWQPFQRAEISHNRNGTLQIILHFCPTRIFRLAKVHLQYTNRNTKNDKILPWNFFWW